MQLTHESIFASSIRSFFVSFSAIIGFFVAFIPIVIILISLAFSSGQDLNGGPYTILPDAKGNRALIPKAPVILTIDINGLIGAGEMTTNKVRDLLMDSREGPFEGGRVKGILLHMNTGGGTVFDSYGIYRVINEYKEQYSVPVYVFVDGICASGGLYIASAANKIYASETSLVGSVGVLMQLFNVSDALNTIGVKTKAITMGKDKDLMSPLRPWRPEEEASLQKIAQYYYTQFVDIFTASRQGLMNKDLLKNEYGAQVFTPPDALSRGYIDGANRTLRGTLEELVEASGIGKDEEYQVVRLETKKWFTDAFAMESSLLTGKLTHEVSFGKSFGTGFEPEAMNSFLYLYSP